MWRLIWMIPTWIGFTLIVNLPMILLGWILVPVATLCGAYKSSIDPEKARKKENPWVYHFTWRFMFPWDNYEDGIANDMYWKAPNTFLQIIYWSCLRNPANNLRIVPYLSCKIDPKKIRWIGGPHKTPMMYDLKPPQTEWFLCWHGPYSCFWKQFYFRGKLRRFWIGWKIFPSDIYGVSEYRKRGAGFATQWKVVG